MKKKLIRDKLAISIIADGRGETLGVASDDYEYKKLLCEKVVEEAKEVYSAKEPNEIKEELADLIEVIQATAYAHGLTLKEVEQERVKKAEKRGKFELRITYETRD
jgi:predicted house-cleaning noncanonical NTP pyrophosphatase (MazG superfamily)